MSQTIRASARLELTVLLLAVVAQLSPAVALSQDVDARYDFEPGERVLAEEDYSRDNVGDFPRRLEFRSGNIAVVDRGGERALRMLGSSAFDVPLPEPLPEQFTIEFDLELERHHRLLVGSPAGDIPLVNPKHPYHRFQVSPESDGTGVLAGGAVDAPEAATPMLRDFYKQTAPIKIMVDGSHAKMYVGDKRVANLPNGRFARTSAVRFVTKGGGKKTAYLGPIRIAAGGRDLYEALEAQGRVPVHTILFDTDAATIRAESAETLSSIARMLDAHPRLRLLIEGHTDATGDFDHNMELSQRRAESVLEWLVEHHGIDRERLRTNGLGPTYPREPNDSESGRQQNRRVELVRIGS